MGKTHAFIIGLVKGADFMGTYVRPNFHSPGYVARKFGVASYDFSDYPNLDYRLGERSSLEKMFEAIGVVMGAGSNICFCLPQIAAYLKRALNKEYHRLTFLQNCFAAMGDSSGKRARDGQEREQAFAEKLRLLEQY